MRFNYKLLCLSFVVAALLTACRDNTTSAPERVDGMEAGLVPEDSAKILMDKVDHYYRNVIHDSLYALAPVAMDYNREHGQWREYYTTWCLLVNDLVWNGQMDKGLDEALKMHHDAMERHNAFGLSEAYTAMGIAYHFQNNNKESVECYEEALKHYPTEADQSVKLNIYSYYCQVLADIGDHDTMGRVLGQWKDFLDDLAGRTPDDPKNIHRYFRFHREKYKYHFMLGQYQQAAGELDKMQEYLDKEDDREVYEAQVAGLRTRLAIARKNEPQALFWSNREIELSRNLDFNTYLNALQRHAETLQALGHYEEALKAYNSYDQQKDSLIKDNTRKQLNEMNKRFELDELKAEQQRTQYEHERGQLQLILIFTVIVLVALMLFILFRQRAEKRLREAHALLEKSNEELRQSYEHLQLANARAEESSKMKSDFIHQISHEIRTPLNVLSGFTQIITTPGIDIDDEEKVDISQRITENTDRITKLVNKMLELSEANSRATIERSDEVTVEKIARQAIEDTGISHAAHIEFLKQLAEGSDTTILKTNLRQASRALSQLLDNAQKFTKQGTVRLSTRMTDTTASFIVEDTGIGIPIFEAERIFGEFVQLDEYYDGTGIGLAVARSISRRLGGDVMLDTSYTAGARFVLMLPR